VPKINIGGNSIINILKAFIIVSLIYLSGNSVTTYFLIELQHMQKLMVLPDPTQEKISILRELFSIVLPYYVILIIAFAILSMIKIENSRK